MLPPQVNRLCLDLNIFLGFGLVDNRQFFIQVPETVNENDINRLFQAVPDTVQSLHIGALRLGEYHFMGVRRDGLHFTKDKSVFLALHSKIRHLSLTYNDIGHLQGDSFDGFFISMPAALRFLHLGYNKLNEMNPNDLGLFLSKIPSTLETLGLCGNQLSTLNAELLENSLSMLPETLKGLDIGENGLLLLSPDEFAKILGGLPKTLTSLRVCEKGNNEISKPQFKGRFNRLPGHIELLSFSDSNLLNYSMSDFVEVLADLPETVTGLDLSHNNLGKKTTADLQYLLANVPPQIRLIKLNDNGLGCLEVTALRAVLSALAAQVWELDVSANGLDRLPYTQMQKVLSFIPSTVKQLITGSDEFRLRNDGALVSHTGLTQAGLFKSQKRFHHQPEFARLRLVMMQFIQSSQLPFEILLHIFSYVFCHATKAELITIGSSFSELIISSVPPLKITAQDEEQCIAAVKERINKLLPNDNCLDLSRCGLNRLKTRTGQQKFRSNLEALSKKVTTLNLRGNGFLFDDKTREVFVKLIGDIPEQINCLDLSDNGFEHLSADELAELFPSLPPTIQWVVLDHETPLSPAQQIEKRYWPESYLTLTEGAKDTVQGVRAILDDYTKGGSAFWRFVYGHWNRHHADEVTRLMHYIDKGLITEGEDLDYELEQIPLSKAAGSLARRFCFLSHQKQNPPHPPHPPLEDEVDKSMELQSFPLEKLKF